VGKFEMLDCAVEIVDSSDTLPIQGSDKFGGKILKVRSVKIKQVFLLKSSSFENQN
jgi:hypothetical protein